MGIGDTSADTGIGIIGGCRGGLRLGMKLVNAIDHALFPPRCAACEDDLRRKPPVRDLPADEMTRDGPAGAWVKAVAPMLCEDCRRRFTPAREPLCPVCGQPYPPGPLKGHRCEDCTRRMPPFDMARSAGGYDGPLRNLIRRFKFERRTRLAEALGCLMAAAFRDGWNPASLDRMVPVPMHPRRFRERGFNPAYLLLRALWREMPAPPSGHRPRVDRDLLARTRNTRSQTGLNTGDRRQNVRGAFALRHGARVDGEHILLVDDVMTTGATAAACASVLKAAGARRVDVLTLARTHPSAGKGKMEAYAG